MAPLITSFAEVQVTVQTDKVTDIPCGTSGGVLIYFDKVEVVNRLEKVRVHETVQNYTVDYDKTWIFDKIHHEINQFCSSHSLQEVYIEKFAELDESLANALQQDCNQWAPGIKIIAIRVTKPRIPDNIRLNYERMEAEKTKLMIAEQNQKVVEKEADTDKRKALIEAEKLAEVNAIVNQRQVKEKEANQMISRIEDEMHLARERAYADAIFYKATREAEANKLQLTPEYLQLEAVRALANNTKVFFGDKIPSMFSDRSQVLQ